MKAFILGAGLGTRLRPLTENLPKPLVPVWNAPLISYGFDHLIHDLGVSQFLVNTHHAADCYQRFFPDQLYRDCPIEFRHEPTLLDTAGGLDNARDWLPDEETFVVYNGDILTDLPLANAALQHQKSGDLVTLILRSSGANPNVGFDPKTAKVTDMRNALGTNASETYQFTGIYLVSPAFLAFLRPNKIESVVIPFLEVIKNQNRLGGVVIDEGHWYDLGDIPSYLNSLKVLHRTEFPAFGLQTGKYRIDPTVSIPASAQIDEFSSIGAGAVVGDNVRISESIVWPGATVHDGEQLHQKVVLH